MTTRKTRATATTGVNRGRKKGSASTKLKKLVKGIKKKKDRLAAMIASAPKVESGDNSYDGKRIKSEDNEQRSQDLGTVLCSVEVDCGEGMNKEEFRPILRRNLKELLPDNTHFRGFLYSNTRGGARAFFVIRFNNRAQWVDWALDGFNENSNRTTERALEIWEPRKRTALFEVVTRDEWKRRPGWACNLAGYPAVQTPDYYYRRSEPHLGFYNGPPDVKGFLKEMKLRINSLDRDCFGDPHFFE